MLVKRFQFVFTLILLILALQNLAYAKGKKMSQQSEHTKIIVRQNEDVVFELSDPINLKKFNTTWSLKKEASANASDLVWDKSKDKFDWDYSIVFVDKNKKIIWLYNSKHQIVSLLSKQAQYFKLPDHFNILEYK